MGEIWRLMEAIQEWSSVPRPMKYFLIAEVEWHKEATAVRPPVIENLQKPPYYLGDIAGVYAQDHARHTRDQAEWVMAKVQELSIKSLALYVSPYHLLRAYLTLVKTFISLKVQWIPIMPVPVAISPETIIPEIGTDAWSMVQGEMERMGIYDSFPTKVGTPDYLRTAYGLDKGSIKKAIQALVER